MDPSPAPPDLQHSVFAPTEPDMAANPQPLYRMMREYAPVIETDDGGIMVTRHEDVMYALRHPEVFSSDMDAIALGNIRPLIPLQIDPPDHLKFRKLLDPLFAPEGGRAARGRGAAAHQRADRRLHRPRRGRVQQRRSRSRCRAPSSSRSWACPRRISTLFLRLKDDIIRPPGHDRRPRPTRVRARDRRSEIYAYFETVIDDAPARSARRPGHAVRRRPRSTAHRLTDDDILDICFLFLIAGLDTVTATLDVQRRVPRAAPGAPPASSSTDPTLVPAAIEELLRWETPVPGVPRVARAGHRDRRRDAPRPGPGAPC